MNHQFYGVIKISGPSAKQFMQGQLTSDINLLNSGACHLTAHCNPKGRVISLFYIYQNQDDYLLLLPQTLIPITIKNLKKYIVFFKCQITDESSHFACLPIISGKNTMQFNRDKFATIEIDSLRTFEILNINNMTQDLFDVAYYNLNLHNIQNKFPIIYPETSEKFLPHEINLHNLGAISFNKGCFTGQEIIARIHYRRALTKQLLTVSFDTKTTPLRGSDIFLLENNIKKVCGNLIDLIQTGYNNYEALISVDEKYQNEKLFLDHDSATELEIKLNSE